MSFSIIPNPFDKEGKFSDITKKAILIKEGLTFPKLFKRIFGLLILAAVLIGFFKIPASIVLVLISIEIIFVFVSGFILISKLKFIYKTQTPDNRSYREIIVKNEYYNFIRSIFGVISAIISVSIIFFFFSNELSGFTLTLISPSFSLRNFIFIFVILRGSNLIVEAIRYNWIRKLEESKDFAKVNRDYVLIEEKLNLITFVPTMAIALLLLYAFKFPTVVLFIVGGFIILFFILSIISLKRIKSVKLNEQISVSTKIQNKNSYKGEEIAYSLFGIMKVAAGFKDMFKPFGTSILGVGKMKYPENTLIATNYRLLFVQIPVTGGDKMVEDMNYVSDNFFWNREEIIKNGEEILNKEKLQGMLNLSLGNVLYSDIKSLTLKVTQIVIEKNNGDKLSYAFLDKEHVAPLKHVFKYYLGEKFFEK